MPKKPYLILAWMLFGALTLGGVMQTFSQYPFQAPDENMHWHAAVARTNSLIPGRDSRCDVLMGLDSSLECFRIRFQPFQKARPGALGETLGAQSECRDPEMNYGFVLSYPGAFLALLLREVFPLSPLSLFYLARFLQGLLVVVFFGAVLRALIVETTVGFWKAFSTLVMGALLLSPIAEQQDFAISPDGLTNIFALLVVYLIFCERVASRGILFLFAIVSFSAIATKPPLIVWLFPLWWWLRENGKFPAERVRKTAWLKSRWETRFLGVCLIVSVLALAVSLFSVSVTVPRQGTDPVQQLAFIKAHPLKALSILYSSVESFLSRPGYLSNSLGWIDYDLTVSTLVLQRRFHLILGLAFLLPVVIGFRSLRTRFTSPSFRQFASDVVLFGALWASLLLISLFLYLYWSFPQAVEADGLQIRYFIPHYLVWAGWLGYRLDKVYSLNVKETKVPAFVFPLAQGLVAVSLLAYLVERNFNNLLRYF